MEDDIHAVRDLAFALTMTAGGLDHDQGAGVGRIAWAIVEIADELIEQRTKAWERLNQGDGAPAA
jgi:hypothetical protein